MTPDVVSQATCAPAQPLVFACWADGRVCEVWQAVSGAPADLGPVADELPCSWCRGAERAVAVLANLRLGRLERRVLLTAPGAGELAVIPPEGDGRAADEAHRRAIRKLWAAELVWCGRKSQQVAVAAKHYPREDPRWGAVMCFRSAHKATVLRRSVCLSPLGEALVATVREELQTGGPIRWARHREALVGAVREDTAALVARFRERVQRAAADWAELTRLSMGVGDRQQARQERETLLVCRKVLAAMHEEATQ